MLSDEEIRVKRVHRAALRLYLHMQTNLASSTLRRYTMINEVRGRY